MMFLFPNILSNFCVPTLFKEYYEKHSGEAVGRGQTAPMRHPKVSQSFSLGGLTAVNVGKHSNCFSVQAVLKAKRTQAPMSLPFISSSISISMFNNVFRQRISQQLQSGYHNERIFQCKVL